MADLPSRPAEVSARPFLHSEFSRKLLRFQIITAAPLGMDLARLRIRRSCGRCGC